MIKGLRKCFLVFFFQRIPKKDLCIVYRNLRDVAVVSCRYSSVYEQFCLIVIFCLIEIDIE